MHIMKGIVGKQSLCYPTRGKKAFNSLAQTRNLIPAFSHAFPQFINDISMYKIIKVESVITAAAISAADQCIEWHVE